jgi:hypothetical protein
MPDRSKRRQVTPRRRSDMQAVRGNEPAESAPAIAHPGLGIFAVGAGNMTGPPSRPFPVKQPTDEQFAKWMVIIVIMLGMLTLLALS